MKNTILAMAAAAALFAAAPASAQMRDHGMGDGMSSRAQMHDGMMMRRGRMHMERRMMMRREMMRRERMRHHRRMMMR